MRNPEKYTFLVVLLLHSFFLTAQKFDKNYFVKTFWYVDNNVDEFEKSDTLKLIKHAKFVMEWRFKETEKEYEESEILNSGHGALVELRFKEGNVLFFNSRTNAGLYVTPIKPWRWKYKKQDSSITIYDDEKKVILKFKPLFEKQIEIYSESDKKMVKTIELTVVRI